MIISKSNEFIKKIRALQDKKWRDEYGLYVATGEKLVKTARDFGCEFYAIITTANFKENHAELINSITTFSNDYKGEIEVSEEVFKHLANEVSPQGILAVLKKPQNQLVSDSESAILLDGVADPTNVGAIIRTALASGYKKVFALEGTADAFSPKSVRASMGGVFGVSVINISRNSVKEIGLPLIVADMFGESVYTFNPPSKFCLVIGNEGNGVSKEVKSVATHVVSIPMENGTESLNASVSAGILMYTLKYKKEI